VANPGLESADALERDAAFTSCRSLNRRCPGYRKLSDNNRCTAPRRRTAAATSSSHA